MRCHHIVTVVGDRYTTPMVPRASANSSGSEIERHCSSAGLIVIKPALSPAVYG